MSMLHTIQNSHVQMRQLDVTLDDTAMDLSTAGERLTDITERDIWQFETDVNAAEIIFWAEGTENATMGCEVWGIGLDGIGQFMADLTGSLGTAWADVTNTDEADATARLFFDDVSVKVQEHIRAVSAFDNGNNRVTKIATDLVGLKAIYLRFYNVGGANEVKRVNGWARTY